MRTWFGDLKGGPMSEIRGESLHWDGDSMGGRFRTYGGLCACFLMQDLYQVSRPDCVEDLKGVIRWGLGLRKS